MFRGIPLLAAHCQYIPGPGHDSHLICGPCSRHLRPGYEPLLYVRRKVKQRTLPATSSGKGLDRGEVVTLHHNVSACILWSNKSVQGDDNIGALKFSYFGYWVMVRGKLAGVGCAPIDDAHSCFWMREQLFQGMKNSLNHARSIFISCMTLMYQRSPKDLSASKRREMKTLASSTHLATCTNLPMSDCS